jgi:hypothetical protein
VEQRPWRGTEGEEKVPCDLSFQVDFQYHVPHVVLHFCLLYDYGEIKT